MNRLQITRLPLAAKFQIAWSFMWRGVAITVASMMCGGIVGGIFGGVFGFGSSLAGVSVATAMPVLQVVGGIMGLMIGLFFVYVYVRWMLSSRLGKFRLILVLAEAH